MRLLRRDLSFTEETGFNGCGSPRSVARRCLDLGDLALGLGEGEEAVWRRLNGTEMMLRDTWGVVGGRTAAAAPGYRLIRPP